MSADDAGLGLTALASPVTLAPKSARPMAANELPPDLLAALEQSQGVDLGLVSSEMGNIEGDVHLDTTMSDLFGDGPSDTQGEDVDMESLFHGTGVDAGQSDTSNVGSSSENMGAILTALSAQNAQGTTDDLFGPLSDPGAAQSGTGSSNTAPSPASLLASFTQGSSIEDTGRSQQPSSEASTNVQPFDYNDFDIDFGQLTNNFNGKEEDMMVMERMLSGDTSGQSIHNGAIKEEEKPSGS